MSSEKELLLAKSIPGEAPAGRRGSAPSRSTRASAAKTIDPAAILRCKAAMLTETLIEDTRWRDTGLPDLAERASLAVLTHLGLSGEYEISVLACDDSRIAALNGDFRDKPRPTNVLSWPAQDLAPPEAPKQNPVGPTELGDIALSYDTCLREATDQAKPMDHHLTHLMVHAALHLLGYDHISDAEADRMEAIEAEILASLGVPNPY